MDYKEFEAIAPSLRQNIVGMVRRLAPGSETTGLPDDVAQDILLRLWTRRDSLDSYRSVEALAMVMARNLTIDVLRRGKHDRNVSLIDAAESPDTSPDPQDRLEASEDGDRLNSIIASLPSAHQALIRMRHIDELEIEEIAALTGSTPGAIRVMLSRVRKNIKDLFLNKR